MTKSKEICTVFLGNSMVDDDYTLYQDGQVKRFYDRNAWSLNNVDWLDAKKLNNSVKQKLLDECPEEFKEEARKLLGL
ncbi:hypothetical protein GNF11_04780 [Nostoc sp. UCD122]|uniref:hypothetical protein n=1 Tax=unclassified Nostoc TaxID=2593658 RepID=UPI001629836E|nr:MULTISPECIES: hypothetical protein [unclassified Nostoc]MBC1221390.1 hypothetical protein [Nostoc sp. UCD120]MBC1294321.1 hypothetical protein [Nostoc sp. UCD122]